MDSPRYKSELLKCVRCGSCKALCPTYDKDTIEPMGARGRLALLRGLSAGQLASSPSLNDRIFSCTLCGACSRLCASGVDIKEIIYHGRGLLKKSDKKRTYLRILTKFFTKRPELGFKIVKMTQHLCRPYLAKRGILPSQTKLPDRHLKDNLQVVTVPKKKGRVAVFTGCMVNYLYPHLGEALIDVLHMLGYEVILPAGEVCCGMPLRALGLEEDAAALAQKNVDTFSRLNVEAVVSLCPTCTLALKSEYPKMIGKGVENILDVSSFLIRRREDRAFSGLSAPVKNAFYHDPCHLKYGLGVEKEPREIIGNMGIDLIRTREESCCGFAGTFCLSYRKLSQKILGECMKNYSDEKAEMIITSCPGCILQLSKEIKNKPVLHLIEVIEEAMLQRE
jgi:glycolate dehydrogenase iron-sulfur subunit